MTDVMYNVREGGLLIGDDAITAGLENSEQGDIVNLGQLVMSQEFPYDNGDFVLLDTRTWKKSDYEAFGKWALRIVSADNEDFQLTQLIINNLRILGVGPSVARIKKIYGNMGQYRQAMGQKKGHAPNFYKEWQHDDYVRYANKLREKLGRIPSYEDYQKAAREELGPSEIIITDVYGGVRWLNEALGQPNIYDWTSDDYVNWAVKVVLSNDGRRLTARLLNILSKKKLGPSASTVACNIGISVLNELAQEKIFTDNEIFKKKVKEYREMIQKGTLPKKFDELCDQKLIERSAKYFIAKRCLTSQIGLCVSEERLNIISCSTSDRFVALIQSSNPSITAGFIERVADDWGLFEDIWSPKIVDKKLNVDTKELGYRRLGNELRYKK